MKSEELLAILAEMANENSSAMNQRGVTLEFDGRFDVSIEIPESGENAYLHAPLPAIAAENRDAVFALALQMQMFFLATEGNAFSYDMKRERLILFRILSLPNLTPAFLLESIESFVNQVERWTNYFSSLDTGKMRASESIFQLARTV
jgi:hypothetical protein